MLLAFAGISGIGKTFFSDEVEKTLGFKKMNTYRTRNPRLNEKKKDFYITKEKLNELKKLNEIGYEIDLYGNTYAYRKDEVFSKENYVVELHYKMIDDWQKLRPDMIVIYLMPVNIEDTFKIIKERGLSKLQEDIRIKEAKEQYALFDTYKQGYDYIIYNNYDEESKKKVISFIQELLDRW